MVRRVSGLVEGGNTKLYDAVLSAYNDMKAKGDPKRIRTIVLLMDGKDIDSQATLDSVGSTVGNVGEEGGTAIKLFAIAYGSDANKSILKQMAEPTGGERYDSDPATINQVYADIATFF